MIALMQPRTLAIMGALALAAGWSLATTVGPRAAQPAVAPVAEPEAARVAPSPRPVSFTETLRRRLQDQPDTPQPTRNPFVFGARTPIAAPARRAAEPDAAEPGEVETTTPPGPVLTLSGVASDVVDGKPERTAIVSDGHGLHFVKAGDALPGGFTVVNVDETMVTLRDASGGERTLRLR